MTITRRGIELVPIGSATERVGTWDPTGEDDEFLYIDLSAVDQEAKCVNNARWVPCADAPSRARQIIMAGDVLVSTVRPNLNAVAYVPEEFSGATASTGFCVLRPTAGLNGRFLFHWVRTPAFVGEMVRLATGASYPAVSDRIIKESLIPLPPLDEQRRIAAILDQADALRAKRRQALARLDALTQSIFLDMFGDPVTNPKGWPVKRIDEVTECLDRLRRPVTESLRVPGPVPYYGANGQQGWIDQALFDEPLVLVAEDGGHFEAPERGVAYRIEGPSWVNNHAHILRAVRPYTHEEFLFYALRRFDFLPFISGTTRAKLTQGQLNSVKIFVPPWESQLEFAYKVISIQSLTRKLIESNDLIGKLFLSFQYKAFQGTL